MSSLNQIELQNLRHIIGSHDTIREKFQAYAQQAMDQQVRDYFEKSAQDAMKTKQQLMTFLK
jgi:type III secretory pathway component EscR